jgi:hypothetical protein
MRTSCIDLAGALFLSACLLVVSGLPGVAVGAAAYDPLGAAVKADQYWNSTNYPSPYGPNGGTDCTNYASIMMHLGAITRSGRASRAITTGTSTRGRV